MKFLHLTFFELKRLTVLFIIWTIIWAGMAYLIVSTYDAVASNAQELQQLTSSLPKEFFAAFSVTAESIVTFNGYFNSQFTFLFLISVSLLASYLGVIKIGKEISNKSLLFLATKPISRMTIFLSKLCATLSAIIMSNSIVYAVSILAYMMTVKTAGDFPIYFYTALFTGMTIFQIVFLSVGFLLSTILDEGKALGLSILLSLLTFIINIIAALEGMPEFVKYLSPYSYLDIQYIAQHSALKFPHTLVFIATGTAFFILALSLFRNKDLEM